MSIKNPKNRTYLLNTSTKIIVFLLFVVIFISCNVTKHVPEGEYLLEKNTVVVNDKKETSPEVLSYLHQKPNQKVLGIPFSLYLYNWGNPDTTAVLWPDTKPKFKKWLTKKISAKQVSALTRTSRNFNNWKLKSGNPPVISDDKKIDKSVTSLKRYYFFNGYRDVKVDFNEQKTDSQKVAVQYNITTGEPYFLDTISSQIKSPILDSIYNLHKSKSAIKTGQQFKLANFQKEEDRLIEIFRNSGIYKFGNNAVKFEVDTSNLASYKQDVLLKIDNRKEIVNDTVTEAPYQIQKVKRINVYTDFSLLYKSVAPEDLPYKDYASYNNIHFYAPEKLKHNPKYLANSIIIQPNGIYKDSERDLTRKYLRELENFRPSIDISYKENDDETLTAYINLRSLEKFGLSWDADFTTSGNKPFGILGKLGFLNRNVFRGAEIFELSFQGSFVNSSIGRTDNQSFLNALEISSTASLRIPRIFFPIKTNRLIPKQMNPKTNIRFSLGFQENIGLDRRNITGSLDYTWQSKKTTSHKFELLNLQYINNRKEEKYFSIYRSEYDKLTSISDDVPANNQLNLIPVPEDKLNVIYQTEEDGVTLALDKNGNRILLPLEYIKYVLDPNNGFASTQPDEYAFVNNVKRQRDILTADVLVPVMSYEYNYNNREDFKDNSFSTFTGRLISSGSLTTTFVNKTNEQGKKVLFGLQVAQYFKPEVEYKKYWEIDQNRGLVFRSFLGAAFPFGNSDNIPFSRSYRAGGSNDIRAWRTFQLGPGSENSNLEFNVGSLKLTSNLEYRFKLINSLNGALFVDAGNIWDISKTNLTSSEGKFKGFNSIKDVAVGSGFGARYDFGFLIFRLDLGFKTYEPYLNSKNKWFKNYNFKNSQLNIGIGYPF